MSKAPGDALICGLRGVSNLWGQSESARGTTRLCHQSMLGDLMDSVLSATRFRESTD
ncbi:MAG: hypothetical protein MK296_00350 [Gammaproteobacteria bacterium]|nr:hypothetical protein [Gammaproteobacteria bacterium]